MIDFLKKTDILPCPCCKGEAEIKNEYHEISNWTEVYIQCKQCGVRTKGISADIQIFDDIDMNRALADCKAMIEEWNTRKPVCDVLEALEDYREDAEQHGFSSALADIIEMVKEKNM